MGMLQVVLSEISVDINIDYRDREHRSDYI